MAICYTRCPPPRNNLLFTERAIKRLFVLTRYVFLYTITIYVLLVWSALKSDHIWRVCCRSGGKRNGRDRRPQEFGARRPRRWRRTHVHHDRMSASAFQVYTRNNIIIFYTESLTGFVHPN